MGEEDEGEIQCGGFSVGILGPLLRKDELIGSQEGLDLFIGKRCDENMKKMKMRENEKSSWMIPNSRKNVGF